MLRDELGRRVRQPVRERDLLVLGGLEYRKELRVCRTGVLDVMAVTLFDHGEIAGAEVIVNACGPVLNTVMRPWPLTQYCHSSAFGCQCISRMPPGLIVSSAAAIVVDTLNVLLSAIRTLPL